MSRARGPVGAIAIIDTNVVVAGLLTGDHQSPVARILDAMLSGALPFVLSEDLLAEYRAMLLRPKLRKLHGLADDDIDAILTDLAQLAIVLTPARAARAAPDTGDQLLWDLLQARSDLVLVTGDKLLQGDATMAGRVLTPSSFADERLG